MEYTNKTYVKKILASTDINTGITVTSLHLHYPRIILAEVNTHRAFSKNTSSSRAKPFATTINELRNNLYISCDVRTNIKGMSSNTRISDELLVEFQRDLVDIFEYTVTKLAKYDGKIHKQHINRYIEVFTYVDTIITATDADWSTWENLLKLRLHPTAQPEFQFLSQCIKDALNSEENEQFLDIDEYHLPYIQIDEKHLPINMQVMASVARAARISYKNFNGVVDINDDIRLYNELYANKHFSAFEHCARNSGTAEKFANFHCFQSYRNMLENK